MNMATASNVHSFESARLSNRRSQFDMSEWRDRQFNDIGALCKFLSEEIRASKMKFSKIAEMANCHPTTVAHLARNETGSPRASTVLQVLRALGFEVVVRG